MARIVPLVLLALVSGITGFFLYAALQDKETAPAATGGQRKHRPGTEPAAPADHLLDDGGVGDGDEDVGLRLGEDR